MKSSLAGSLSVLALLSALAMISGTLAAQTQPGAAPDPGFGNGRTSADWSLL